MYSHHVLHISGRKTERPGYRGDSGIEHLGATLDQDPIVLGVEFPPEIRQALNGARESVKGWFK